MSSDIKIEGLEALIPGAGHTSLFIKELEPAKDSLLVVAFYASPGDNIQAAMAVYGMISNLLKLSNLDKNGEVEAVVLPHSWTKVFGNEMYTRELY
jgi:hypothetical protein